MGIFTRRLAFKPFEFPDVMNYVDAINYSYWLHSEWNFTSDIQDFKVTLDPQKREVIKNTLLAISQIEVSVKTFWGKLGDRFPKPEFNAVGASFAESEVRHERAYSHLLEVLNLNGDFELLLQNPVIQGRVDYLSKYIRGASDNTNENYTLSLALFSLFIENVSLFSQFFIVRSFNKELNVLKDIDNVVQATQKEEVIHALMGVYIINQVKKEFPEWFNDDFYQKIYRASKKAYEAEEKIIDWIFDNQDLDFLSRDTVKEFTKYRFNESVEMIGGQKVFDINEEKIAKASWFINSIYADTSFDFFNKRSTNYTKRKKPFTVDDIFKQG